MKRLVLFIAFVLCLLEMSAREKTAQDIYIEQFASLAVDEMYRSGIPASITLAQGLLESGYGLSELAVKGNNHFGIKCHNNWHGDRIYHDDDAKGECFRKYPSPEHSYRDHSDFLRYRDRYKFLFDYQITDYKSWAHGLKKAGYATDPSYPTKLIRLIEEYELYQYDARSKSVELPVSPSIMEGVEPVPDVKRNDFHFSRSREVFTKNGVAFVYSAEGDTYEDIAAANNLFSKEILRYNDLSISMPLAPGTVVFLQGKKRQSAKGLDKHVIEEGETMRDISQRYGIRLSSLYKMNGMSETDVPAEGDILKLRK